MADDLNQLTCQVKLCQVFLRFFSVDFFFCFLDKNLLSLMGCEEIILWSVLLSRNPTQSGRFFYNFFNRQSCVLQVQTPFGLQVPCEPQHWSVCFGKKYTFAPESPVQRYTLNLRRYFSYFYISGHPVSCLKISSILAHDFSSVNSSLDCCPRTVI